MLNYQRVLPWCTYEKWWFFNGDVIVCKLSIFYAAMLDNVRFPEGQSSGILFSMFGGSCNKPFKCHSLNRFTSWVQWKEGQMVYAQFGIVATEKWKKSSKILQLHWEATHSYHSVCVQHGWFPKVKLVWLVIYCRWIPISTKYRLYNRMWSPSEQV